MGDELLTELVAKTDGFSGAHMKELVEFARMISEEEEIEIGKALIMSLDKLTEQRELIEEIRANKVDVKAVWNRVKYEKGEVGILEDKEIEIENEAKETTECPVCARDGFLDSNKADVPEDKAEEISVCRFCSNRASQESGYFYQNWDKLLKQKDEIIAEKDGIIADLKEGRVLSRKNRGIVKNALVALEALLKADAAGTTEDEESETGTVTERSIELEKEGKREFSTEEIAEVVKEVSGKQMGEILKDAFKKALDPEKMKTMVGESIRLELQKLRGKVE